MHDIGVLEMYKAVAIGMTGAVIIIGIFFPFRHFLGSRYHRTYGRGTIAYLPFFFLGRPFLVCFEFPCAGACRATPLNAILPAE